MEQLKDNIKEIIKEGFEIILNKDENTERDVQHQIVLPVLEALGYLKRQVSLEKHCRTTDKKDLHTDIYIEVDKGQELLVETKKARHDLSISCLAQLVRYLVTETIRWGILTNGSRYILVNTQLAYENIGEQSLWQSVVLDIDFGIFGSSKNERYIEYLGPQRIFGDCTTYFFKDIQQYFCYNKTLSPKNYNSYRKTLQPFFDYYIKEGNTYKGRALEFVRPKDAVQFLRNYKGSGRPRVKLEIPKSKVDHICAMYKVLLKHSYIQSNPMEDLKLIVQEENNILLKGEQEKKRKIEYNELLNDRTLNIVWKHLETQRAYRRIIFILIAYYGFEQSRVVNFLNLTWEKENIDLGKKVFHLDGNKYHIVKKLYDALLEQKKQQCKKTKQIHCNVKTGTLATTYTVSGTFDKIKEIQPDHEIMKSFSAEALRSALIKHLFYAGISFEEISYLTGLNMSQYSQYVTEQDILKQGMKNWRSNRNKGVILHPFSTFFEDTLK